MKKLVVIVVAVLVVAAGSMALRIRSTHGQVTVPATTGMIAQLARGAGAPAGFITCNAASAWLPFWDTTLNQISVCDGSSWQLDAASGGTITGITTTAPLSGSGTSGSVALSCPTCVTMTYIKGTSGTITGTLLAAGGYDTGTVTVAGATVGMRCGSVTPTDGTVLASYTLGCTVTGSGTNNVTVWISSPVIGTPPSKAYNFAVLP